MSKDEINRTEWEQTDSGWLVVEHGGMLKTGPFASKAAARRWFAEELDKTIGEAEHPRHCLCTGCATERELDRGGRYDSSIASHLHHIKDLRALREAKNTDLLIEKVFSSKP